MKRVPPTDVTHGDDAGHPGRIFADTSGGGLATLLVIGSDFVPVTDEKHLQAPGGGSGSPGFGGADLDETEPTALLVPLTLV